MNLRICAHCGVPLVGRADAVTCSRKCRQARHRFQRECHALELADRPLRLAYADPPYPGLAHYYADHPDYAGEVDHCELLSRLEAYDGWALSTSADALHEVEQLARDRGMQPRVAVWVRGSRPHPGARRPLRAWEPVLYVPARRVAGAWPDDVLVYAAKPRRADPHRVIGAKPAAFCTWLFGLLGARAGDDFDDLYPGSGGVGRAWRASVAAAGG